MFQSHFKLFFAFAISVFFSYAAHAQTAAEKIRKMSEEISVLTVQLQKMDIESKIAQKHSELKKPANGGDSGVYSTDKLPTVVAIEGVDGKLKALLSFADGSRFMASEGENIGNLKIKKIFQQSVLAEQGQRVVTLSFGKDRVIELPPLPGSMGMSDYQRNK